MYARCAMVVLFICLCVLGPGTGSGDRRRMRHVAQKYVQRNSEGGGAERISGLSKILHVTSFDVFS